MRIPWPSDSVLQKCNKVLLVFILLCNAYVLLAPLWPQVTFAVDTKITKPIKLDIGQDATLVNINRSYNHIIIPKLQLDKRIYEGQDPSTANLGVWRRPNTSQPGKGSNTVLVGHRFTYDGPSVFYHLDKLHSGDELLMVWSGKIFIYKVTDSLVVSPNAVSIENPTDHELLTIYTCHPMWSVANRLVVRANLERTVV